jgi:tetratricopeptide (TPR) repeat protein
LGTARLGALSLALVWLTGVHLPASSQGTTDKVRALIDRGNYLMSRQQFQQAIDDYQEVLGMEPNNPYAHANIVLAHNNWGIYYFHKSEFEKAKAEWDKALTIDPNDRNAKNNLLVLKRTLTRLGKNLEEPANENPEKAEKAEEKKKQEPVAPSGVVLLTPQKKQEVGAGAPGSESTSASYTEQDLKQAEVKTAEPATNPQAEAPAPPAAIPVRRTKAEDELDAFRRMTNAKANPEGAANDAERYAVPPAVSTFRPVPTGHVSNPTSFLDDIGTQARPKPAATPEPEAPRPHSAAEFDTTSNTTAVVEKSQQVSNSEDAVNPEQKAQHKKRHTKQGAAESSSSPWTEPPSGPSFGASGAPENVDAALNKLETKIYGQPRPQPSVLKRLERMEIDSFGQASLGSITERIQKLKKLYNLTD